MRHAHPRGQGVRRRPLRVSTNEGAGVSEINCRLQGHDLTWKRSSSLCPPAQPVRRSPWDRELLPSLSP